MFLFESLVNTERIKTRIGTIPYLASLRVLLIQKESKLNESTGIQTASLRVLLIQKESKRATVPRWTLQCLRVLLIQKESKHKQSIISNSITFESLVNTERIKTQTLPCKAMTWFESLVNTERIKTRGQRIRTSESFESLVNTERIKTIYHLYSDLSSLKVLLIENYEKWAKFERSS